MEGIREGGSSPFSLNSIAETSSPNKRILNRMNLLVYPRVVTGKGKGERKELEDPELQVDHLHKKLKHQAEVNEVLTNKLQEFENVRYGLRNEVDQKEGELSHMVEAYKDQGTKSSKFINEIEEQLRISKIEIKNLQTQKTDLEAQLAGRAVEAIELDEKNKELSAQTSQLEQVLKAKGDEILDLLKNKKDNEYQLKSKIEELVAKISVLQVEVDRLRAREGEVEVGLDEEVTSSENQPDISKQSSDSMNLPKAGPNGLLESKIREVSHLQVQMNSLKDELSAKNQAEQKMTNEKKALHMQVTDLESDVESLHRQKNNLEEQMSKNHEKVQLREENEHIYSRVLELEVRLSCKEDGVRQEFPKILLQMESETLDLRSKIEELQKALTEKEVAMTHLVEESKQFKRLSAECKLNYQAFERKQELLAEEFRKTTEENIRLLFRRIKVAEKMHYETKENHKSMKETLGQENASLSEKLAAYESEGMTLRDGLEPRNKGTKTKDGKLEGSLSSISNTETEAAATNAHTAEESDKTEDPTSRTSCRQDNEMQFDKKVRKLESQLSKEEANKLNLIKVVSELKERMTDLEKDVEEKDKLLVGLREEKYEAITKLDHERKVAIRQVDEERREAISQLEDERREVIRQLGEEKREAIRQLCVLIDHHRSRCENLQQLISNVSVRSKKRS